MNKRLSFITAGIISISLCGCSVSMNPFVTPAFTIRLNNNNTNLVLADNSSFKDSYEGEEFGEIPPFDLYTYNRVMSYDAIDSEETDRNYGLNVSTKGNSEFNFLKYTFFIKNVGEVTADYTIKMNIAENIKSESGQNLDSILRVMVYQNDATSAEHNYAVYAKKAETPHVDEEGNPTDKEFISVSIERAKATVAPFPGFAEMFESDTVIFSHTRANFAKNDAMRYTIVIWLEGEDEQTTSEAPVGASIKLGVTIDARES